MDTWLFLCDLCSLKKNLTVFPEASFNDCISDSLVRTSQRDRAKPFLFGSVGCCLTVNDVWIPDERAMPPLPTIPGSTAAGANSQTSTVLLPLFVPRARTLKKQALGKKSWTCIVYCPSSLFVPRARTLKKQALGKKS